MESKDETILQLHSKCGENSELNSRKDLIEQLLRKDETISELTKEVEKWKTIHSTFQNFVRKKFDDLENEISQIKCAQTDDKCSDNSQVSSSNDQRISEIDRVLKNNGEKLSDVDLKVLLLENCTKNGHLLWKVNNFQKRREEAMNRKITALHSPPCFTKEYGYKYCIRLYLNGEGNAIGTHLSIFFVIMASEHDNILQWPFLKKVQFTLLNLEDRCKDIVEIMRPNRNSTSFQKPTKELNVAAGPTKFVAIDQLNDGFIKDDALYIDVKIQ